ncbi:hypothetical protein ABWK22_02775 [Gottfriedia acidiceleris]|uniref:hypothetical protein n=1 Tax=Gottfriedia acidiceleris TaxID=371036 RepID=UPI003397E812
MNNNEIFAMYLNSLNQQTQALQQGYTQFLQQQQPVQQPMVQPVVQEPTVDVNALVQQQIAALMPQLMKQAADAVSETNEEPRAFIPPQPVMEDIVEDPAPQEYVIGNKQYELVLRIDKPCNTCPFASKCSLKPSLISAECGVTTMKDAAISAGEIHIDIQMDTQTMKASYLAYKDGVFIGNVADNRENKTIRAELEKYIGQTVRLLTHEKKALPNYTFTSLFAEILGTTEKVQPLPVFEETISDPQIGYPEPPEQPEEITLDLGEMVLPI